MEDLINATRGFTKALKRPDTKETVYRTFVERVRERLHVVLAMSPIGDALRVRCRKFPALVNCCTINWFFPWPEEALINVASAIL
jgi:dynein heavy chain